MPQLFQRVGNVVRFSLDPQKLEEFSDRLLATRDFISKTLVKLAIGDFMRK